MFYKEGYNLEDLLKEESLVFFDIDSTLGSRASHESYKKDESYKIEKRAQMEKIKKDLNVHFFSFADFVALDIQCLAMFQKLLKDTNSKAVCVSSWVVSLERRTKKCPNEVKLLNAVFKATYENWEEGLVVAGIHMGGDRGEQLNDLLEEQPLTKKNVLVDDSVGHYPETERTVKVNGITGFDYSCYEDAVNKLKILGE
jgi:hypothetical protein